MGRDKYLYTWVEYKGQPYFVIKPYFSNDYELLPGKPTITGDKKPHVSRSDLKNLPKLTIPIFKMNEKVFYSGITDSPDGKEVVNEIAKVVSYNHYSVPYSYSVERDSVKGKLDFATPFELYKLDL